MGEDKEKLGALPFVVGGLSFIPLIGVLFGVAAIAWGLGTKKSGGKKLALIGAGGIAFTVLLYASLFYLGFVQRGGIFDGLRARFAESSLTSLVPAIEFYKTQNGTYPESLDVLKESLPKDSLVIVYDPTHGSMGEKSRGFFYEVLDENHYYLLGVGADGEPFTSDDIHPNIEIGPDSNVGLLIKRE